MPLKHWAGLLFIILGVVLIGADLLDGDITVRRFGHMTAAGTPVRFALFCAGYVIFLLTVAGSWLYIRRMSRTGFRPRVEPAPEEPDERWPR